MDGQLVQQHLVVPLEEVVQVAELRVLLHRDVDEVVLEVFRDLAVVDCRGEEGQDLFSLGLESPANLCGLKNPYSQLLILSEFFDCVFRVVGELFQSAVLLVAEFRHLGLQLLVVAVDVLVFLFESHVSGVALLLVLDDFEFGEVDLRLFGDILAGESLYHVRFDPVLLVVFVVSRRLAGGLRSVLLVELLELLVELVLLGGERHLHVVEVLQVLVLGVLGCGLLVVLDFLGLFLVFLHHGGDHVLQLLDLSLESSLHLLPFPVILRYDVLGVLSELLLKSSEASVLQLNESFCVDEMVAQGDLELVLGLIEVLVEHLYKGLVGVELTLIILRKHVNLVLQLLGLGYPHYLPPIGQQLSRVEAYDLLLVLDL